MLKVSVVLPVYNGEKYLNITLESILSQTYKNIEIIIIDDGSTTDVWSVLKIHSNHIRYIRQANQGVSAARNNGILHSEGDLVAFIDQDDFWLPDKIAIQVDYLIKNNFSMVYCDMNIVNSSGEVTARWNALKKRYGEGWIYEDLLHEGFIVPSVTLIKKSVLLEAGMFDPLIANVEDVDLWLRIARKYPIGLVPGEPLVHWRWHADNNSKDSEKNLQNLLKMYHKHLSIEIDPYYFSILESRLSEKYYLLGRMRFSEFNFIDARKFFVACLKYGLSIKAFFLLLLSYFPVKFLSILRYLKKSNEN